MTEAPTRRPLRLASYNVEWFNALFDDRGRLHEDAEPSARYGISRGEQVGALGIVFSAMDADGVMIIEGPDTNSRRSTVTALESFARHFGLRARRAHPEWSALTPGAQLEQAERQTQLQLLAAELASQQS